MMVKLTDTIITDVAVSRLRRAKDKTCLTVLHSGDCESTELRPPGCFTLLNEISNTLVLMSDAEVFFIDKVAGLP